MVTLSIIVVSYNTKALLQQCLYSVFHSLRPRIEPGDGPRFEIFVIDNDSRDGSADMITECFPVVKLIKSPKNVGFAAANNIAIARATGKYLLFLNPDTLVKGEALWEMVDLMESAPEAGVATGSFVYPDGSFQDGAFRFPNLWMTLLDFFPFSHRLLGSSLNGRYPKRYYSGPFEIDHPLGACFIARREVVQQVGVFSEDFFLYSEEVEWCWRVKRGNWKIYCYPKPTIVHYGGQSTGQQKDSMYLQLHKSRLTFFKKHYDPLFCAVNRVLVAAGVLWESFRALRSAGRAEITSEACISRIRTCIQIFKMVVRGV
ncbi:MAG: glycosyltransferase family 2 protein [Dehalococcoidia bacterium]|nr:glycosyltransferase family 2 protein [Dehalococcoidia bacterium]